MFFINKEFSKIVQDAFLWTNDQMEAMNYQYFDTILKLIINDTFDYLEKNSLPEMDKVKELQKKYAQTKDIAVQSELLHFLFSVSDKYIEFQNQLTKKINELNIDLCKDFIDGLDYESGLKVLAIMDKELTDINNFEKKFLNFASQKQTTQKNS